MTEVLTLDLIAQHPHNHARVCRVHTYHGSFTTPVFMPVGTRAGVNNMTIEELHHTGSQIILGGNTYHMLCAPGMSVIKQAGGMHKFMGWSGPMLTDSGGFQVFSLSKNEKLCHIDETGAHFTLPNSDKVIHMTPEMSLETQKTIGADIIMAFDQCTPDSTPREEVQKIMDRTHRWLGQSLAYHQQNPLSDYGYAQALFGIIQGGLYDDLRQESADYVTSLPLDGIAIGGESIGFNMDATVEILSWIHRYFPEYKPRYSMGVGMSPQDLLDVVEQGVDMFDCVAPTRNARHGALYHGKVVPSGNWLTFESEFDNHRLQIKKGRYVDDKQPIMPDCQCRTCQQYTRADLHRLIKQKAGAFTALACVHNIHVLQDVCAKMRDHILAQASKHSKQ